VKSSGATPHEYPDPLLRTEMKTEDDDENFSVGRGAPLDSDDFEN
jgi:hypothetical protein